MLATALDNSSCDWPAAGEVKIVPHVGCVAGEALAGPDWNAWGLLFTRRDGQPYFGEVLTRDFQNHLARLGLPKVRFHDLRHSCATFLLSQGLSPRVVMETLGHSNIHTTLQIYAHLLEADRQAAADVMDTMLGSGSGLGSNSLGVDIKTPELA